MRTAILLHGMPSKEEYFNPLSPALSNKHWFPWVQRQLLLNGILAQTPELPEPYEPDYEKWREVFERFKIDNNTTLIGHSCGGGFLVRWLSENKIEIDKLILVAPWINSEDKRPTSGFFTFEIDPQLSKRANSVFLLFSTDDDKEEIDTAEFLKINIDGLEVLEFSNKGHFTSKDMQTEEFPELVEIVIK